MKINLNYDELVSKLDYANSILSDKSVEEKLRNIIFLVGTSKVEVIARNAYTFVRSTLENCKQEDIPESGWNFQLKSGELNKILSAFSNMTRTEVKGICLEVSGVCVKATIHEEDKVGENASLTRDSDFLLDTLPVSAKDLEEITMGFPEDLASPIAAADVLLYLDLLFPVLNNDTANGIGSKINFAGEYVFVVGSAMSAFVVNKLPDAFKDICLTYSSVSFLKKISDKSEQLIVAKTDKYLCVLSEDTVAFMKYQRVKINYSMYVDKKSKDKGIVVDRLYLKDVLKRMSVVDDLGKIYIDSESDMTIKNGKFEQSVPLSNCRDAVGISFSIPSSLLSKMILGSDSVLEDPLRIYFVESPRGYLVYMSDSSGAWFSNSSVSRV